MGPSKKIGMMALALLITGSIDSIRNMPATALFGPKLIFFAILGAIFFLIPIGLVSAQLVTSKNLHAGIYGWVREALGKRAAFFAIWLQWINTMVWYPTILSFFAGTAAYLINPQLAQHPLYLVAVILVVFWGLTLVNLKGFKASAWVASVCAVVGMIIPALLILGLGLLWLIKGLPLQVHFNSHTLVPQVSNSQSWISLTAIITSFLGMELACVHARDVDQPSKNFPKALLFAVFFILATMILCSMVIAWVLPQSSIHLVDGTMQVFNRFFDAYHLHWMLPIIALSLVVGSIGGMINWVISPAKGLLHAAEDKFLPEYFCKLNKHGVAQNLLIIQALLVSFMCLAFALMPSVNGSYWLLSDLSTELYVVMYAFLFIAALILKLKGKTLASKFKIWGGKLGTWLVCMSGLLGCMVTLLVGFFPPSAIDVGSSLHYILTFSLGIAVMVAPVLVFYWYQAASTKLSYLSVSACSKE